MHFWRLLIHVYHNCLLQGLSQLALSVADKGQGGSTWTSHQVRAQEMRECYPGSSWTQRALQRLHGMWRSRHSTLLLTQSWGGILNLQYIFSQLVVSLTLLLIWDESSLFPKHCGSSEMKPPNPAPGRSKFKMLVWMISFSQFHYMSLNRAQTHHERL